MSFQYRPHEGQPHAVALARLADAGSAAELVVCTLKDAVKLAPKKVKLNEVTMLQPYYIERRQVQR